MQNRILIVDDSAMARMFLKRVIEATGLGPFELIEAGDGQEALDILGTELVDIVITDLIMPVLDGEGLLREIREDPALDEVRVIVVSSASNANRRERLILEGAQEVLEKPVNPVELAKALQGAGEADPGGGDGW